MTNDQFQFSSDTPSSPARDARKVTPSDTIDFPNTTKALYVGAAGDVTVITLGGTTTTFTSVPAGAILPIRCTRVLATGTSSTSIVGLF